MKTKSTQNVSYKNQTLNVTNVIKCKIINIDIGKLSLNNGSGVIYPPNTGTNVTVIVLVIWSLESTAFLFAFKTSIGIYI